MKTKFCVISILIGVIVIMGISGVGAFLLKEINDEKSFSIEEINEIRVDIGPQNVHFIEAKANSEVKIHLNGKAMRNVKIVSEINNKTLSIKLEPKWSPLYEKVVLDIYLPKTYEKNLSINVESGALRLDSFQLANITLNASSGKVEAESLNAEKISIKISSGSVKIKRIAAKELEIKGQSGAINIEECIVNQAKAENSSGGITLKNCSGTIGAKTSSGSVWVIYKEFEDQNINIKTSSGSIALELPAGAEFLLEAKTSTGNIRTDFPIKMAGINDKKKIEGQVGNKSNKVLLQTTTGSIKILKK